MQKIILCNKILLKELISYLRGIDLDLLLVSLSAGIALGREVVAPAMNLIRYNMGFELVVPFFTEVILTSVTSVTFNRYPVYLLRPVYKSRFALVSLFFPLKWSVFSLFFHEVVVYFWSVFCDFVVILIIGDTG